MKIENINKVINVCYLNKRSGYNFLLCSHIKHFQKYIPDELLSITLNLEPLKEENVFLYNSLSNKMKLSLLQNKIKILENKINKFKKPICQICYAEMTCDTKIAQCINGHLICFDCKHNLSNKKCAYCNKCINGRAFGMEIYLRALFQEK